jgi:hypothetical protein
MLLGSLFKTVGRRKRHDRMAAKTRANLRAGRERWHDVRKLSASE